MSSASVIASVIEPAKPARDGRRAKTGAKPLSGYPEESKRVGEERQIVVNGRRAIGKTPSLSAKLRSAPSGGASSGHRAALAAIWLESVSDTPSPSARSFQRLYWLAVNPSSGIAQLAPAALVATGSNPTHLATAASWRIGLAAARQTVTMLS
jgi:hypothetical protein